MLGLVGRRAPATAAVTRGWQQPTRTFVSASRPAFKAYGDEPTIVPVADGYREYRDVKGQGPGWWLFMAFGTYCFIGGTAGMHKSIGNTKDLGPNCTTDWQRQLGGVTNRDQISHGRRWIEVPDEKGRF
mmetsp:Transcript_2060/g.4805  ORF Transcript_2060/g.4805 Transcript_2060/m.4805 type:complete len:129 (+) Transcript_2060:98-484(+)